jgi:hypothetical protein
MSSTTTQQCSYKLHTDELVCMADDQKVKVDRGEPSRCHKQTHEPENYGILVFAASRKSKDEYIEEEHAQTRADRNALSN